MLGLQKLGITALCVLALGAVSNAQVSVGQSMLHAGENANVTVMSPSKANQTVVVCIEDVSDPLNPKTQTVAVTLDEEGHGVVTWTVEPWEMVRFRVETVGEATRLVMP